MQDAVHLQFAGRITLRAELGAEFAQIPALLSAYMRKVIAVQAASEAR